MSLPDQVSRRRARLQAACTPFRKFSSRLQHPEPVGRLDQAVGGARFGGRVPGVGEKGDGERGRCSSTSITDASEELQRPARGRRAGWPRTRIRVTSVAGRPRARATWVAGNPNSWTRGSLTRERASRSASRRPALRHSTGVSGSDRANALGAQRPRRGPSEAVARVEVRWGALAGAARRALSSLVGMWIGKKRSEE